MPERLPDINLLPRYERRGEGSPVVFYLFLFLTIAAFIAIGVFYFIYNNHLETAERDYESLQAEEETLQAELASLDIAEGESHRSAVEFVENQIYETSELITRLKDLLPRDSYLNHYTYRSEETSISAHFDSLETVASYTSELNEDELFLDVKLLNINNIRQSDDEEDSETEYYEGDYDIQVDKQLLKKESMKDE